MTIIRSALVVAILMIIASSLSSTSAQEKPATPAARAAERVTDQDQQTFALLLYRVQVQQDIIAVLQKEVDSTNAEVSRLIARLQKPGFELIRDPQTGRLEYVVKSPPPPEKKEPLK